jgi:hypothetical protein
MITVVPVRKALYIQNASDDDDDDDEKGKEEVVVLVNKQLTRK